MEEASRAISAIGGLKIIGAGFGRTGTLSLKVALEELGFGPCYHMTELFGRPGDIVYWEAAVRGDPVDWKALFQEYRATVDWPGCAFYEDLMKVYPDAKVLLTVRDPESWYESVSSTIYQVSHRSRGPLVGLFFATMRMFMPGGLRVVRMINALIWQGTFGDHFEDRARAIAIFNAHIEEVKQRVAPDKLLVYNVKEGWEPLCRFLGVEVPVDQPFPHVNDRVSFTGNLVWQRARANIVSGLAVAGAVSVVLAVVFALRRLVRRDA